MKIYIDSNFKCHLADTGGLTTVETDFFVGKCDAYIEGYRFVPAGQTWTREDGVEFAGEMIAPWKPWDELDAVQRVYERQQIIEYEAALQRIETAAGGSATVSDTPQTIEQRAQAVVATIQDMQTALSTRGVNING